MPLVKYYFGKIQQSDREKKIKNLDFRPKLPIYPIFDMFKISLQKWVPSLPFGY